MKKIAMFAFAGALAVGGVALADYTEVKDTYVQGAFADADDDWMRHTANNTSECSYYGSKEHRRVDVLVARYNALGDALSAGDEAGAISAGQNLATAITANKRFETCWKTIARKKGVSSKFQRAVEAL